MLLRPFLLLFRGRLILVGICSLVVALVAFYVTSAEGISDLGVFWHHYCGCPPDAADVHILLYSCILICFYMGAALGFVTGLGLGAPGLVGGDSRPINLGDTRFLLTRPTPRRALILPPLLISTLALSLIPALSFAVVFGWLRLVHAPALAHIAADFALAPSAANLGPHHSLLQLLASVHAGRFYLAAISIGLCTYTCTAFIRWLVLHAESWLRPLALAPAVVLILSPLLFMTTGMGTRSTLLLGAFMWAPKGEGLAFQPSLLAIALHIAFAAAVLLGSWRMIQRVEL